MIQGKHFLSPNFFSLVYLVPKIFPFVSAFEIIVVDSCKDLNDRMVYQLELLISALTEREWQKVSKFLWKQEKRIPMKGTLHHGDDKAEGKMF